MPTENSKPKANSSSSSGFLAMKNAQHKTGHFSWWRLPDSNWGHKALQASALPTELNRRARCYFTRLSLFVQAAASSGVSSLVSATGKLPISLATSFSKSIDVLSGVT
jgi:hypothetical protein